MSPNFKVTIAALFALACMIVMSGCEDASAAIDTDVLTWTRPTQRVDGSALAASEILQYRIRFSDRVPVAGPCNASELLPPAPGTDLTITRANRPTGRSCYTLATVDTSGLESAPTNLVFTEKCLLGTRINTAGTCVALSPPREPGNVQAQ